MFKSDPMREQLRALWIAMVVVLAALGALILSPVVASILPTRDMPQEPMTTSWKVIGGLIVLAGGYLCLRDHLFRPIRYLMRHLSVPAEMWRLLGRLGVSAGAWAPVVALGFLAIVPELSGGWSMLQIGFVVLVLHFVNARGRHEVNRIVRSAGLPEM